MIRKTIIVQFVGICLLASALFTVNTAQSADLGGDCCDDLEERIADLDTTTDRKGNRRVSLTISGWVARSNNSIETLQLLLALNSLPNTLEFEKAQRRLAPKAQYAHVNNSLQSSASFGNSLLSCGVFGGGLADEGQCNWAQVSGNRLERDTTGDAPGLDKVGFGVSLGSQFQLAQEWRLGFAAGYENSLSKQFDDLQALDEISGDSVSLGMVVKNRWGPISGAFSLSGSYGWYESERYVGLVGVGDIARSDQNVGSISSRGRLSYLFGSNSFYLKPMIDFSATWLHLGAYSEAGAGGANLHQDSASQWIFSATPALEIGGEFTQTSGWLWRPYLRMGVLAYDRDNLQIQTQFIADPTGDFTSWDANFEQVYGEIEAGLKLLSEQGLNLKLSYEGRYGEHTRSHAGHLKFSVKF